MGEDGDVRLTEELTTHGRFDKDFSANRRLVPAMAGWGLQRVAGPA